MIEYVTPTILTRLWRRSQTLRPGDGVVMVHSNGSRHHATVDSVGDTRVSVWYGNIAVPSVRVVWNEGEDQ